MQRSDVLVINRLGTGSEFKRLRLMPPTGLAGCIAALLKRLGVCVVVIIT
jgi:hypothetical protein